MSALVPSTVVLLLALSGVVAYDIVSFRIATVRTLTGTANFIAFTSPVALRFEKPERGEQILAGLATNPNVMQACIYDHAGDIFATYPAGASDHRFPTLRSKSFPSAPARRIWIFAPVEFQGEQIGTVFIEANYSGVWRRLGVMLAGLAGALTALLLLAFAVAVRLQRHVSLPLISLTRTARRVSDHGNYSARAEAQKGPEFSLLTETFNRMLDRIETQDAELRSRAAQLERANKELEAFTYTVSHDLRAPLRSISGFAHLLSRRVSSSPDGETADLLNRIVKNAEKMAELIDNLLAFSRIDAEPLQKQTVHPNEIAREVIEDLRNDLKERQLNCVIDPVPSAQADPALLRQVYANLVSNALKYSRTRDHSEIHIGSLTKEERPVYFVRDNGVGFDMKHAQNLFKIFQRLHRDGQFEGIGVGLAIVERVISRHGGKIWAEAAPDNGATFYFTLGEK